MKQYWEYIIDDKLKYLEQTVLFLTDEFSFSFVESPWSKEYFKWKLGNDNPAGPGFMSVAISNEKVVSFIRPHKNGVVLVIQNITNENVEVLVKERIENVFFSMKGSNLDGQKVKLGAYEVIILEIE